MNLEIIPQAKWDIREAARYYRLQREGLDEEFLSDVYASAERILENPLQFEQVRPGIRCCLLDRFPYGIYFRLPRADTVRISVVKHHRRRPGYGMRRS